MDTNLFQYIATTLAGIFIIVKSIKTILVRELNSKSSPIEELQVKVAAFQRAFMDITPVLMYEADANGNITFINREYEKRTGLRIDDALGSGWLLAVDPRSRESTYKEWLSAVRQNRTFSHTFSLLDNNKNSVLATSYATPIKNNNRLLGFFGTIQILDTKDD